MKILANYELKDMGQPIKETSCWLFLKKERLQSIQLKDCVMTHNLKSLENY